MTAWTEYTVDTPRGVRVPVRVYGKRTPGAPVALHLHGGAFTGGEQEAFADERIGLDGGVRDEDRVFLAEVALAAAGDINDGSADEPREDDCLGIEDEAVGGRAWGDALLDGVLKVGAVLKGDESEIVLSAAAGADAG